MREERINAYRVAAIVGMVISAILSSGFLCYMNNLKNEEIIAVILLALAFFPIICFELTYERRREMIGNNAQTSYKRALTGFLICSILVAAISFMPPYFKPVLLLPLIMSSYSNDSLGLITGLYYNVLLTLVASGDFYELLTYIMLVLIGGMLSKMLKHVEYRLYIGMIYLFSSVLFPNLCHYFVSGEMEFKNLLWGLLNGFIAAIYVIAFYPIMRERTMREKHYYYGDILADDFAQIRIVRKSLPAEYYHARKVSEIAYKYALALGLKEDLAAAAGFYYHLGKWEGDPPIESGVRRAQELCFPNELVQILKEYNAIDEKPSTPESALVHMIDGLLVTLENASEEVRTSKWDRDVLMLQTLNDFSAAGYYDNSGLSINSFMRIREWLSKEEFV